MQKFNFDQLISKFIKEWTLELYHKLIAWKNCDLIYHTTFEKLMGPNGGGNSELQLTEIKNIAKHFSIPITEEELKSVAQKMWGDQWVGQDRWTFREGQIGAWKKHFKDYHIKEFKKHAGNLLVDLGYE